MTKRKTTSLVSLDPIPEAFPFSMAGIRNTALESGAVWAEVRLRGFDVYVTVWGGHPAVEETIKRDAMAGVWVHVDMRRATVWARFKAVRFHARRLRVLGWYPFDRSRFSP